MTGKKKSPLRGPRLLWHRLTGAKVTTLDGVRLICDPGKLHRSVATAIIKGSYEQPERILVRDAIRTGDKVVEIGTGVGAVSLLCNKLAGVGNVTSFEANAALEPIIRENFALNGLEPRLNLRAVTVDGQPITFFRDPKVVSSSVIDLGLKTDTVIVESLPINQVLAENAAAVLVMDVEGAEIELLGAADLSGLREIVVELHPHIVGEDATETMIAAIKSRGFVETGRIHKNIRLPRNTV